MRRGPGAPRGVSSHLGLGLDVCWLNSLITTALFFYFLMMPETLLDAVPGAATGPFSVVRG